MQPPDRDLTSRFLERGDEEAFRLLFRRHTPRLYALALRLLGGRPADADDVVQEAWIRVATRLGNFEWRSALSTWITSILINCARERLRTRRPDPADVDLERLAGPRATPAAGLDLERAIAALPDGYRAVLVLHDIEGLTHEEIGAALEISAGTSKSQLWHARRAVRAHLNGAPDTRSET